MPIRVDKISKKFISGWGYDDDRPDGLVQVIVRLNGAPIAVSALDRPLPAQIASSGGTGRAFIAVIEGQTDIVSMLSPGALLIEAIPADAEPNDRKRPIQVHFERHLLHLETLLSGLDLFGILNLEQVASMLAATCKFSSDVGIKCLCFDLINYSRAYFAISERTANFYRAAELISRFAGMPNAASFYASRLHGDKVPGLSQGGNGPFTVDEDFTTGYASLKDLIPDRELPNISLEVPPFITGLSDASFLLQCGIIDATRDSGGVSTIGFRVNGFGDNDWSVTGVKGRIYVAEKLYRVDFEFLRNAINKGAIILLDMSAEGPLCQPQWIDVLNYAIRDLEIPFNQLVLVTQNLQFPAAAHKLGLQAASATAHYFLKRGCDVAVEQYGTEQQLQTYVTSVFAKRAAAIHPRKYLCLNYTPRWARWAVVLSLFSNNLLDSGYVSFPGISNKKLNVAEAEAYTMPPIRNKERYLQNLPQLLELCPLSVDVDSSTWPSPDFVFPTQAFEDSFFHIVTETEMSEGTVLRVTEKVLKPIIGLQPFIIFGNPGSLKLLQGLGFKTFESIFDESYDSVMNIHERFDSVEEVMLQVCNESIDDLKGITDSVTEILLHNFIHLIRVAPLLLGTAVHNRLASGLDAMARTFISR